MLVRNGKRWEQHLAADGGRARSGYVFRVDGDAEGFAVFTYSDKEDVLEASQMIANTRRAYAALLGIARRHSMTIRTLKWSAPANDSLPTILANWDVETKVEPAGMARIVDVQKAIEALSPDASLNGSAVIGITDKHAPWNAGTWEVSAEAGHVTALRTTAGPHVEIDIQGLAQAYWGSPSIRDLRKWGLLSVHNEAEFQFLEELLPPTPAWLYDDF